MAVLSPEELAESLYQEWIDHVYGINFEQEIADVIQQAILAERERCAKLIDRLPNQRGKLYPTRSAIAASIRKPPV